MLALAYGGQTSSRFAFQRRASNAGCATMYEHEGLWIGGQFPAVPRLGGARWIDGSLDVRWEAGALHVASAVPIERPLFLHRSADGLMASSSLELLVDQLSPRLSVHGLAARILASGLAEHVPFQSIERVPGGTVWTYSADTSVHERPMDPALGEEPEDVESAARLLRNALHEAVGKVLGRGAVGVFVSGGLDSSAVLATLAEHIPCDRIVAVTWALDERSGDRPFVDAWSRRLGLPVHRVTAADSAPFLHDSLVLGSAPTALMTGAFERAAMHRAQSLGADRMLTGVGGDESFAGSLQAAVRDDASLCECASRSILAELPWVGTPSERVSELWLRPALRAWLPNRLREASFAIRAKRRLPLQSKLLHRRLHDAARLHVGAVGDVPRTATERWLESSRRPFWLEMGELRRQLEVAGGLARFDIPLDPSLHHVLARIPPRFLFDEARHRGLLRRVLENRAPQVVTGRIDKADFDTFVLDILRRANAERVWEGLARMPNLARLGLAPAGGFGPGWRLPKTAGALDHLLEQWPFLSAEAFAERYS